MTRRAQTWSVDLVIALVIFGFITVVVTSFSLLNQPEIEDLQFTAERVSVAMESPTSSGCSAVLEGERLILENAECLFDGDQTTYESMRNELGVEGDFCIYFEDESGQIYQVETLSGSKTGWGSPELVVGGTACGQPV